MSKSRTSKPGAKAAVMRPAYRPRVERDERKYHRPSVKQEDHVMQIADEIRKHQESK
jgi:hypothetical protein